MNFNLPFNWFDVLTVVLLFVGIQCGRKHGLSVELLKTLMWISIAAICGLAYAPVGSILAQKSVFSLLSGYLMAYVAIAGLVAIAFVYVKRALGGKLIGSDTFGGSEFYLGMLAGMIRFACILISVLALLNARYYNPAEIRAKQKFQSEVYGSNFFPELYEIQAQVFEKSLLGPVFRNQLGFLLIKPTAPEVKEFKQREYATP